MSSNAHALHYHSHAFSQSIVDCRVCFSVSVLLTNDPPRVKPWSRTQYLDRFVQYLSMSNGFPGPLGIRPAGLVIGNK
jgi:hypothetical protein